MPTPDEVTAGTSEAVAPDVAPERATGDGGVADAATPEAVVEPVTDAETATPAAAVDAVTADTSGPEVPGAAPVEPAPLGAPAAPDASVPTPSAAIVDPAPAAPDAAPPAPGADLSVPPTPVLSDAAAEAAADPPRDTEWRRVSPKYVVVEVVGSVIGTAIFAGGLFIAWSFIRFPLFLWAGIAVAVIGLVGIAFEPRRVRSIGYRLREDDLLFRRGIMFHRQVAVPYGRMQLIDITRGPVARALGLADLKFVTAAAATAVTVPGLPMDDAERLRDRLVALAETRRAGL